MKKETARRLTREQRAELTPLAARGDEAIDTSEAPEFLDPAPSAACSIGRQAATDASARWRCRGLVQEPRDVGGAVSDARTNRALREYVQGR